MSVVQITNWRITAGRNVDFLALVSEAKKIHERLGGRVRVRQATFAGENAGRVAYVIEHDDMMALASFGQKMQADSEWQAFVTKAFGPNPSATLMSNAIATDVVLP